ncbi:MAG TPA: dihydrolipoamide acetyltransferase family protein [Longilinea sp.]|nr:dihydrolipoamide acetyltransferase family protein [Longilinea sp.]
MAETVTMPKLGFDMAEGTLVRWVKNEGEQVKKGDVLAEIETDKATVEVESSFSGIVSRHLVEAGTSVPVGAPIALIGAEGEKVEAKPDHPVEKPTPSIGAVVQPMTTPSTVIAENTIPEAGSRIAASPLARRIAGDSGIDIRSIKGSGPGGRIVRKDIEDAMAANKATPQPGISSPVAPTSVMISVKDETVKVDRLRAAIGRRMVESKTHLPHFYVTHEYDVESLLHLRKMANEMLGEDKKLSVNDFIIKATALALRQFPNINASINDDQIIRHAHVNVGVAVSIPGGLMTVVVKDADQKDLPQISAEVKTMAEHARQGKVRPDDIEGSTFSISNLGMFDVENFIAIINPPEAAILAVGSARAVPVVKDGSVVPGQRMKMTISADHRVTDGVEAAQFMQALVKFIESPLGLLVKL